MKNETAYTINILPRSEEEYIAIQKLLSSKEIVFNSNVVEKTDEDEKSVEEIQLEGEYLRLADAKLVAGKMVKPTRFRLKKEESAIVTSGERTRLYFLKKAVKTLKKAKGLL